MTTPPAQTITQKMQNMPSAETKRRRATSLKWFFNQLRSSPGEWDHNSFSPMRKDPFIGGMFFFVYDAKFKATLPYWDKFPLVIPISTYNDGFLGLNLHYLAPILRGQLLDALMRLATKKGGQEGLISARHYMKLSYPLLQSVAKSSLYEPCLHRYLSDHIKSKVVKVGHQHWEEASFLPVQQFQKKSHREVWGR